MAVVGAGCAGQIPDVYHGYPGEVRPDTELAIVRGVSAVLVKVDGKPLNPHPDPNKYYHEARLLPGQHTLTLYSYFMVSIFIVPKGSIEVTSSFSLDLEAGHVYELHGDRTTGAGFRVFMWIEDASTGEVIAGERLD